MPTWTENSEGFVDGDLRMLGVVERLTQDREVDGFVGERHLFDVAQLVREIREAVFLRELRADFHHPRGVIDAPDLVGALGEKLGEQSFAGAEICDVDRGGQPQGEVADGFPRTTGTIVFAQSSGDEVEILLLGAPAFLEDAIEIFAIFGYGRKIADGFDGCFEEGEGAGGNVGTERIEGFFAVAAIGHEIDLAKEGELGGDPRLAHSENLLEFSHGEFFAEDQGKEAKAGRVGKSFKDVPRGVHAVATVSKLGFEGNCLTAFGLPTAVG